MQKRLISLIFPLVLFLSACASSSAEQTLVAQNEALSTQVAYLHGTATIDADHMVITLESAQAQLTDVQFQATLLAGTLIARNVDPTALAMFTPQGNLAFAQQPTEVGSVATQVGATIFVPTPQGARGTTPVPSGGATIAPQATQAATTSSGAALYNPVMSTGVNNDDCAIAQMTQFTPADAEIYVVALTQGIQAGMTLLSRWSLEGVEQISHSFAPDNDIPDGRCVWFYIDQTEVTFSAGNWTVQLEVDGASVGSTQFTITP